MWGKKIADERVTNLQNKIYREIYMIVVAICSVSIIYKCITIEVSFSVALTEWMVLLIGAGYYSMRSSALGLFSDEVEMHDRSSKIKYFTKSNIMWGIGGIIIALFMGINSAVSYADNNQQAVLYFFTVFIFALLLYVPLLMIVNAISYSVAKKKSDQVMEKQLKELERED